MVLLGVDGCPGGWFAVRGATDGQPETGTVYRTFAELLAAAPSGAIVAVDIPIGLRDAGARLCDVEARRMLAPGRSSSVFPAPLRSTLAAETHSEASALRRAAEGKGMSIQSFAITRKVREVEEALAKAPEREAAVYEVHPEVSFAALNGGAPLRFTKKTSAGRQERLALLERLFDLAPARLIGGRDRAQVGADDVLDAFVALWTAQRIGKGCHASLPAVPENDRLRRRMAIFY